MFNNVFILMSIKKLASALHDAFLVGRCHYASPLAHFWLIMTPALWHKA